VAMKPTAPTLKLIAIAMKPPVIATRMGQITVMPLMLSEVLALASLVTVITMIIQHSGLAQITMEMITTTLISHPPTNNGHNLGMFHLMPSIIGGQVLQANRPYPLTSSN